MWRRLQAAGVAEILLAKAAGLARASAGRVAVRMAIPDSEEDEAAAKAAPVETARRWWMDASQEDEAADDTIEGLKPWRRAVDKLALCYGGDPARLLDCCRCDLFL